MELVPSVHRRPTTHLQIDDAGEHVFRRDKIQNNNHYYRCTVKNCPSRAVLTDGVLMVSEKTRHNHDPPDVAATVAKWMSRNKADLTCEDIALQENLHDMLYSDTPYLIPTTPEIVQSSESLISVDDSLCIVTRSSNDPTFTVCDVRSLADIELPEIKQEVQDMPDESPEEFQHVKDDIRVVSERPDISGDSPVTSSRTIHRPRKRKRSQEVVTNAKEDLEAEILLATRRKLQAETSKAEAEAAFWRQEERQSAAMTRLLEEQYRSEVLRRKLLAAELKKKSLEDGE